MRKIYVFQDAVAPWEKEVISDPCTPKPNLDPFFYTPEAKSDVSYVIYFFLYFPPDKSWTSSFYFSCN